MESIILSFHGVMDWLMAKHPASVERHAHPPRSWPKPPDASELAQAAAMFRALGDPSRLRLLARLAASEACVTELAELEDEKLTTVSARLQTLYEARLVKRRREAKHVYYALADSHVLRLAQSALEHAAEKQDPTVALE
jgi:ArsR family transcriptional regulator